MAVDACNKSLQFIDRNRQTSKLLFVLGLELLMLRPGTSERLAGVVDTARYGLTPWFSVHCGSSLVRITEVASRGSQVVPNNSV